MKHSIQHTTGDSIGYSGRYIQMVFPKVFYKVRVFDCLHNTVGIRDKGGIIRGITKSILY